MTGKVRIRLCLTGEQGTDMGSFLLASWAELNEVSVTGAAHSHPPFFLMAAGPGFIIGFKCHIISFDCEISFMLVFFITPHLCETRTLKEGFVSSHAHEHDCLASDLDYK